MTYMLMKAATVVAAAAMPAADIEAGLMLKNGLPGAESVNDMFMLVLGTLIDPVAASGA